MRVQLNLRSPTEVLNNAKRAAVAGVPDPHTAMAIYAHRP